MIAEIELGIPVSTLPRVLIVGAGFGGLKLAQTIDHRHFQVVLLDKNNYHQFQPLFYQVAMSGLEPSSVLFPIRKIFHKRPNVHFRVAEILEVVPLENKVVTQMGDVHYDYLVLAMGAVTNYFGNNQIEEQALGMKSVSESLYLRNQVLEMLEKTAAKGKENRNIDIVVVGGGPTGVELSGSLAEMKKMMFPKDYPEIDFGMMNIWLVEGGNRLLAGMSEVSSNRAFKYLSRLGVKIKLNCKTDKIENHIVYLSDGTQLPHGLMIWAAGIKAHSIQGLPAASIAPNGRIKTDEFMLVENCKNIYCIGDQAWVKDAQHERGHPQVAQPAIQQGNLLAKNLSKQRLGKPTTPFKYKDLGSMATVGRNLAVVELKGLKLGGFLAWTLWMAVHLMAIVGVRNRVFIFFNWLWSYATYDQSLRLLIKPFIKKKQINSIV